MTANRYGVSTLGHEKCSRTSCDDGYTALNVLYTLYTLCVSVWFMNIYMFVCTIGYVHEEDSSQHPYLPQSLFMSTRDPSVFAPLYLGYKCT